MNLKIVIVFVSGLITWLLATNFQDVYSHATNFFSTDTETSVTQKVELASNNIENIQIDTLNDASNLTTTDDEDDSSTDITTKHDDQSVVASIDEQSENLTDETLIENNDDIELNTTVDDIDTETQQQNSESETEVVNQEQAENQEAAKQPSEVQLATTANYNSPKTTLPPSYSSPSNTAMPMFNPYMMNPSSYLNPMTMMTPMMMNMMAPFMNPAMYMNPLALLNSPMNAMTKEQHLNAMMMSMDPRLMFGMFGQPNQEYLDGEVPDQLPVVTIPGLPTQNYQEWPKNKVSPSISREAKHNAFTTAMATSPLSMRNMVSMMADKIPVEEGVSWDDAVEAMKLRANEVNFKFVGSSPLWKQIEAETEQPSAKVEMFRFCDARVAREILDEVPEFIVFLPCKIALLEDAEGKLWVMTLDWDVSWLDYAQNPNSHLSKGLREQAKKIRENIQYIMEGAATGDF